MESARHIVLVNKQQYIEGTYCMKTAKIWAILLALLTVSMLAGCSVDDMLKESETVQQEQLILGTSADYAPFEFHAVVGGQDTIVGADIELARKVAADRNKELVVKDIAFENLLDELNKGTVDLVISDMVATDVRRAEADASDVYYSESNQRIVILKKNEAVYTDLNTLAGAKLAVQKGSVQEEIAKAHLEECAHIGLQSAEDMFYRLATGEVDAVLVAGHVADSFIAANNALTALEHQFPESEGCRVWVAKDDPEGLMTQINQSIDYVKINNLYLGWLDQAAELNR